MLKMQIPETYPDLLIQIPLMEGPSKLAFLSCGLVIFLFLFFFFLRFYLFIH